jgi:hypothetical protein
MADVNVDNVWHSGFSHEPRRAMVSDQNEWRAVAFGYRARALIIETVFFASGSEDLWLSATGAVVNGGRWLRPIERRPGKLVPFHHR